MKSSILLLLVILLIGSTVPVHAMREIGERVIITTGTLQKNFATILESISSDELMQKNSLYVKQEVSNKELREKSEVNYLTETFNDLLPLFEENVQFYKVELNDPLFSERIHILPELWLSSAPSQNPRFKVNDICRVSSHKDRIKDAKIIGIFSDTELKNYLWLHRESPECESFCSKLIFEHYAQPMMIESEELIQLIKPEEKPVYLVKFLESNKFKLCLALEIH